MLRTAFVVPSAVPLRRTGRRGEHVDRRTRRLRRRRPTRCQTGSTPEPGTPEKAPQPSQPPPEPIFGRFDAEADTDAFGRDPKKETEFWKDHARSVLESAQVREAIEQHAKDGGDGMTDEQRAYMEFIRKLDEEKGDGQDSEERR